MTMGGLHSCILINKKVRDYCSVENRAKLRAGYCGLVGNKGAISIEVFILGQYFQFINYFNFNRSSQCMERRPKLNEFCKELEESKVSRCPINK